MKQLVLLVVAASISGVLSAGNYGNFATAEEFVAHHNSRSDVTWKATTENFKHIPANKRLDYVKGLCGAQLNPTPGHDLPVRTYVAPKIPKEFDSRQKWPHCPSLNEIRDQGNCGSCWAFGCAEAATDRLCIQSKGTIRVRLSTEDLLACCIGACGAGCNGGDTQGAWRYLWRKGLVSGGTYNSSQGCLPYEVKSCDHHVEGKLTPCDAEELEKTPKCHKQCRDGYNTSFWQDKRHGKRPYYISGEKAVQTEIMKHGPVEVAFMIYADFITYKSGVYQKSRGAKSLGGHAMKTIGWGVENGVKYWLIANSWNKSWGDNGFVKVKRGPMESSNNGVASMMNVG